MPVTVDVPSWYLRDKQIDYESEILQCLGHSLTIGRLTIPSPAIGFFALLDVVDSQFFRDPLECSLLDVGVALALAVDGKRALVAADRCRRGDKAPLERRARHCLRLAGNALTEKYADVKRHLLETPWSGYEMLPKAASGKNTAFLFVGPAIASVIRAAGVSGGGIDHILWNVPLCLSGHLAALHARYEGVKGVERPKDRADMALQRAEALEREKTGELHPWQLDYPEDYEPSVTQIEARFEIVAEYNELMKNRIQNPGVSSQHEKP